MIVDDDQKAVDILKADCEKRASLEVVCATTSQTKAIKAFEEYKPDLLFLDMEMPGMSGLELLGSLKKSGSMPPNLKVVFYTAYNKYMIDAIRAAAFDYLLKPYKKAEFKAIIDRLEQQAKQQTAPKLDTYEAVSQLMNSEQRFCLQGLTSMLVLHHSQVVLFQYIEELRCWQVMLTDHSIHRLRTTTKAPSITSLSQNFKQVNSQFIVNIEYLACIENHTQQCLLYPPFNNINIKVSRHYLNQLKKEIVRL